MVKHLRLAPVLDTLLCVEVRSKPHMQRTSLSTMDANETKIVSEMDTESLVLELFILYCVLSFCFFKILLSICIISLQNIDQLLLSEIPTLNSPNCICICIDDDTCYWISFEMLSWQKTI